jgi:LAS superfamily LD-carboxypeptidase LdcB
MESLVPTTAKGIDTTGFDPAFGKGIWELASAVEAQGGHVTFSSGVRSTQKQAELYANRGSNPNPVAKPGTSLHERGLAADLTGDAKTMALLHKLAPQFGITGIDGDPVHFQLASAKSPAGKGLQPLTPQPSTPAAPKALSLPDRLNVLAGMLSPAGVTAPTAQGTDTASMTTADTSNTQSNVEQSTSTTPAQAPQQQQQQASATAPQQGDAQGIDAFMASIAHQESGGNYDATNKSSGAHGKYQIMPANWASWAREAGLAANAPQTPENQEIVAKAKISQYYAQFGDWGKVAKAWYGGPGSVNKNVSGGAGYPDSNTYAQQVTGRK